MKLEDLLTLGKMGFTKDDISKLLSEPAVETASGVKTNTTQESVQSPEHAGIDYLEEIRKLRQEIARNSANITTPTETVDDVLAKILNPNGGDTNA